MGGSHSNDEEYEDIDMEDHHRTQSRSFDCVMVFHKGSDDEWEVPKDGSIQYDYLKCLETADIKKRKNLFAQHGADFVERRPMVKDFYRNEKTLVVKAMESKKITCQHIESMIENEKEGKSFGNKVFYYLGVPEQVAREIADKFNYELELEPSSAVMYLNLLDEPLAKATASDADDCEHISERYWRNIFVPYISNISPELFRARDLLNDADEKEFDDSLFRIRDRASLIYDVVTGDVEEGGCGIHVPVLTERDHCICDFFPIHTPIELNKMQSQLFSFNPKTWLNLPLQELREYFGEYIALYFAFLQYHNKFLLPAVVVGIVVGTIQFLMDEILIPGIAYYALAIIVWMLLFPVYWRKTEFEYAYQWGTLRFDLQERSRPEFEGVYLKSTVDGGQEEYYPPNLRNRKRCLSLGIVAAFLTALFGSVVAIVVLRVYVAETDLNYGDYYISIANAFVIMFFNVLYGVVAEKMNSWENYRTDTEYENNLILKVFVFRFVNSYASLYYMAFFRAWEDEDSTLYCEADTCMEHLRSQLAVIFLTQIVVSNAIELGELMMIRIAQGGLPSISQMTEAERVWNEYSSPPYERTFDDYNEILVSLGYCTLFAIAFPYAPLLGFISGVVESRIDGYKMCKLQRRPFPRKADDIGMWQLALEVMAWAVLITNLLLICFVTNEFKLPFGLTENEWLEEYITASIILIVLFVFERVMRATVGAAPRHVADHITRQEHVEEQLQRLGKELQVFLDSLDLDDLRNWKSWTVEQVTYYLNQVLLQNKDEYTEVEEMFVRYRVDGRMFAKLTDNDLEQYGMHDFLKRQFIVHTRAALERQIMVAESQEALFKSIEYESTHAAKAQYGGASITTFQFTLDHLPALASYFEEDLAGQSKRKLWQRVDKDESSIVEYGEMNVFLFFAILVFIKAKFPNAALPKRDDLGFKKRIIDPLKEWLWHYHITPPGLRFDDFNNHFSQWIRQFHKEMRHQLETGTAAPQRMYQDPTSQRQESPHLYAHKVSNESDRSGLGASLYDSIGQSSVGPQSGILRVKPRSEWAPEALEWERKLDQVANSVAKTEVAMRRKIWDKFDRNRRNVLDTEKSLLRLLYSLFALYVKSRDRNAEAPKLKALQPLLISICVDIRNRMPSDPNTITREDFVQNIGKYMKESAAKHREKSASQMHSEISMVNRMGESLLSSNAEERQPEKKKKKKGFFGN